MQRRQFMRLAGGGVVLAAVAWPLAGCSAFDVPPAAVAAWLPPRLAVHLAAAGIPTLGDLTRAHEPKTCCAGQTARG